MKTYRITWTAEFTCNDLEKATEKDTFRTTNAVTKELVVKDDTGRTVDLDDKQLITVGIKVPVKF